jgi:hypothetical protein
MTFIEVIKQIRMAFNILFTSSYSTHLNNEVLYLKDELAKTKAERDKIQAQFNSVNPLLVRLQNPPKPITQPVAPAVKRWATVEAERWQEIDEIRRKKLAETQAV